MTCLEVNVAVAWVSSEGCGAGMAPVLLNRIALIHIYFYAAVNNFYFAIKYYSIMYLTTCFVSV